MNFKISFVSVVLMHFHSQCCHRFVLSPFFFLVPISRWKFLLQLPANGFVPWVNPLVVKEMRRYLKEEEEVKYLNEATPPSRDKRYEIT